MKDTSGHKKSTPASGEASKALKKARKITLSYLENAGKFYLEKFPASENHFRTVMMRKIRRSCQSNPSQSLEDCIALLDIVIAKFIKAGFLNDEALAKGLLYSYRQRGLSTRKVASTLRQKGLPTDITEQVLEESPPDDFISALRWVKKKRMGHYSDKNQELFTQKWLASLGRAGFDYETSRRVLSLSRDDIENYLNENS